LRRVSYFQPPMNLYHALPKSATCKPYTPSTIYRYSNSKSTLWDWTVFHRQYVSDWHVVATGETRNMYWILEGTCSGERRWSPPLPSAEVKESVGLYLPFWAFVACSRVKCTFTFYSMDMWEVVQDCIKWWPLAVAALNFPVLPQYMWWPINCCVENNYLTFWRLMPTKVVVPHR